MYKYCFAILFVLFFCNCKEDKTHNHDLNFYTVKNFVPDITCELLEQQIRVCNKFEGQYIGLAGTPSEQYKRFEMLYNKASDEDLLHLTNDTNSTMRCYAFLGLSQRNVMYMESVLKEHLNDAAIVETQSADMVMNEQVNWVIISIASPYLGESAKEKYKSVVKDKSVMTFF